MRGTVPAFRGLSQASNNKMKIISEAITIEELERMSYETFGNLVKAVVDIDREVIAVDAELHSDLEALLLENGSKQKSLWGINLYPKTEPDELIEFDSMINVRPSQGNMSRGVDDEIIRKKIIEVVLGRIKR